MAIFNSYVSLPEGTLLKFMYAVNAGSSRSHMRSPWVVLKNQKLTAALMYRTIIEHHIPDRYDRYDRYDV